MVDVGGGSTDISVFTGDGQAVFLDSLAIGGRDLTEVMLANQISGANAGDKRAAINNMLKLGDSVSAHISGSMLQLLLVLRLEQSVDAVASDFAKGALKGTPADLLALLAFCVAYGIRAAALGGTVNGKTIPEASDIRVWFVGLGSRLFELSPIHPTGNNRLATARKVLEECGRQVLGSRVKLQFDWGNSAEAKLTVCRGALLVPENVSALDLKTIYWADIPAASPSLAWSDAYDRAAVKALADTARRTLSTSHLDHCAKAAVDAVKRVIKFDAEASQEETLMDCLQDDYSRGISEIASNAADAPQHPVTMTTSGLKRNLAGLLTPTGR